MVHARPARLPSIASLTDTMLDELHATLRAVDEGRLAELRPAILHATSIAGYGAGREGLVLRSFVMRLFHLGLPANMVGEMTIGPMGEGGLLVCSAGPGRLATVAALMEVTRRAGGRVALFTARPDSSLAAEADLVVEVPGQTMGGSRGGPSSQPLGSLYEQALWILLDAVVAQLVAERGLTSSDLAARHTNLE